MSDSARRLQSQAYVFGGLLLSALLIMVGIEYVGVWTASGIEEYMHANALWTQAQKNATRHLVRYGMTGSKEEFVQYRKALAVPIAYRQARRAAQAPALDWDRARDGLIKGGTDPEAVTKMVILARHAGFVSDIGRALDIQARADTLIDSLRAEADALRAGWAVDPPDQPQIGRALLRVEALNDRLTELESAFSATIHAGAGALRRSLFLVEIGFAVLAAFVGGVFGVTALRRNQRKTAQLEESKERLQLALHGARMGLWDWDVESGNITAGRWLEGTLGYPEGALAATSEEWGRLLHPDDRATVNAALRALEAGQDHYETEHRMRAASGTWRWIFATGRVTERTPDGAPARVVGVMQDVTVRKETEREIEYSEELHRVTLSNISDSVFITDDRGAFTFVCPNAGRIFGYSTEEIWAQGHISALLGEGFFDEDVLEQEGELRNIERTVTDREGASHVVLVNVKKVIIQKGTRLYTCRDITERKKMEEEVRRSEHRYRTFIEQASDGIFVARLDGTLVEVNNEACAMTGYSRNELLAMRPEDLVAETSRAERPLQWENYKPGETRRFERELKRKDGTTFPAEISARLVDGEVVQAIVRDVSERQRYERELIAAKERAEEMDRLKSSFLANMSHEIRTPLTSIIGFSEVLREELEGEPREMLGIILRSGRRLRETLTSVLDLARLESESMAVDYEHIDLASEVKEIIEAFQVQAQAKGLELHYDRPGSPIMVHLDRAALHRIVTNLVSNAVKFTESGYVRVTLSASDGEIVIAVEDTGIGISEKMQETIFEEFKQASEGFSRAYEGAGLGLTITKQLVNLMEGAIHLESMEGEGTTVTITLPQQPIQSSTKASHSK